MLPLPRLCHTGHPLAISAHGAAINHKTALRVKFILTLAVTFLTLCPFLQPTKAYADSLTHDYTLWQQLLQPNSTADFDTYANFILSHETWPDIDKLENAADSKATTSARLTLHYFDKHPPQGIRALNAYANALERTGNNAQARKAILTAWNEALGTKSDQSAFLATYRQQISQTDIFHRADTLLWSRNTNLVADLLPLLTPQHQALIKARIALQDDSKEANARIAAVPTTQKSNAGLIFDRIRWRNRHDLQQSAADLLHQHPRMAQGSPREWWRQREDLARWALENNKSRLAYDIASQHGFSTEDRYQYTEAEWLAGWIALRALNDPKTAFIHFSNMKKSSSSAVSKARYTYWTGRALSAQGNKEQAGALYQSAAQYGTTFYGQIAAIEHYGNVNITVPRNAPTSQTARQKFDQNELVRLVRLTHTRNEPDFTKKFFLALLETITTQDEATLCAELATGLGRRDLAVWTGKIGGKLGFVVGNDSYPLLRGNIPTQPDKIYIHAIVRQESSFDAKAQSPAGAMGLMQLMPATATNTAKKMGISTNNSKLVDDPMHNITLGSFLLNDLLEKYEGSLVLAAIGYNAGPGRVTQWTDRFGDPRSPFPPVAHRMKGYRKGEPPHWIALDVIESYPFNETRFYIQQVLANAEIYRAILNGTGATRLRILQELTGNP